MQNGSFQRCSPNRFFDSGGNAGNYSSNENFTITICPENVGEILVLNFTTFNTQPGSDIMTIYNGNSTGSSVIGNFEGTISPGNVVSTDPSGCLTVSFVSNGFGNTTGWDARINCVLPCQTISPSIDATIPAANIITNQIEILPTETVSFSGSAIFSDSDLNATYLWDFGTGATANTLNTSHQFNNPGTYTVEFTATDDNDLGCSETVTITVFVVDSIVTINSSAFAQSFYLPNELIEDVLVTGGCSTVDNFSSQVAGGPADLDTKSYGYFTRGGAVDFPFESGIVITSGNAFLGGNTEILGPHSGVNSLPGDSDLEDALALSATFDATFIKFNFTPTTDNLSFRYLLASEEYNMNEECDFADGFAFLLREVGTTTYRNLAVLPDGTPVNVTTINNAPACAANTSFFAGYNLGATNFGGRTEVLTAFATVTPNTTYEIKLVVADALDDIFDTAIFIEAGSFNLGGDLGDDITLASGTAECDGQLITLDTKAPNADHTWFFNGVEISGITTSTLDVAEAGIYSVDVEFAAGCSTSDSIVVEFKTTPEIVAPAISFSECSPTGDAVFNLSQNTPIVFGSQSATEFSLSYHNSQADADTGVAAITNPTNYTGTDGELIFIRIEDVTSQTCFVTTMFTLNVFTSVTSENVIYELCDNNNDGNDTNGIVEFNLPLIDNEVLGLQDSTQFSVSYYLTETDADLDVNALPNLFTNSISNTQVIFARVQNNSNVNCYEISSITLQVNLLPIITSNVELSQCDNDTDGISNFNLTESEAFISINAANETFTYYTDLADANNGVNAIPNPLVFANTDPSSNPDILFVRVENAQMCFRVAQLDLFVSATQIPSNVEILYEECDTGLVDNSLTNGITTFDFSDAETQIRALAVLPTGQSLTFTYYETETDALAETNAILDISNHRNDASPFEQEIYVRVDSDVDNACVGLGIHVRLRTINPTPNLDPDDIILCDDVTVGDLVEVFDLTQNETYIFNGDPDVVASYHFSFAEANSGINAIPNPAAYSNTDSTETIFVRVRNTITNCYALVDFDLSINPLPNTVIIEALQACENATDGIFDFNLDSKRDEILNGQDPNSLVVSFHISQQDADDLTNPLADTFTNSVNPQQIFVALTNTLTGCSISSMSFNVEVIEGAQANSDGEPLDFELCDDNINNDGVAQFDLSTIEDEILDGQNPLDVTVTYHFSDDDALNNMQPLPSLYENITNPQVIFVRVSNNLSPDVCFEVKPIPLKVNPLPEFDLDDIYILCTTTNGTEVVPAPPVIDTGLSITDYEFEWYLDGAILPLETSSNLIPTESGIYTVIVYDITTSTITRCNSMDSAEVIESEPPVISALVTSQAFSGNHIIEAISEGSSSYEFSLDNGPWQDTGFFDNVTGGMHTVYSRDVNGCGISSESVMVIDYPLFFTPNGDGNNDSWNIKGIETQPSAKIYIFDRYGKLLKQLNPTSPGWDGTYQGNRLPTDDYWFTVEYIEPLTGEIKQQRAHFTLKR